MNSGLGLTPLLTALRAAGIPMGPRELRNLHAAFAEAPSVGETELKELLAAILVHTPEERRRFDAVFQAWIRGQDQEVRALRPTVRPAEMDADIAHGTAAPVRTAVAEVRPNDGVPAPPAMVEPSVDEPKRWWTRWWIWPAMAGLAILLGLGVWWLVVRGNDNPTPEVTEKPPTAPEIPPSPPTVAKPDPRAADWVTLPVPRFVVSTPAPLDRLGGPLALAIGAGLVFWALGRRRGRLKRIDVDPTTNPPPPEHQATPQATIFSRAQLTHMVWGIDHFVSDQVSSALDQAQTVRETARSGGMPVPVYAGEKRPRRVWLWRDLNGCGDGGLLLIRDIETALKLHGLFVETLSFRGLPQRLCDDRRREVDPPDPDVWGGQALVLILNDGSSWKHAADPSQYVSTMQQLERWPRLAIVDVSGGRMPLSDTFGPWKISVLQPSQVPDFMADTPAPAPSAPPPLDGPWTGELAHWRAACAVGSTLRVEQALEVHDVMNLSVPREWATVVVDGIRRAAFARGPERWLTEWAKVAPLTGDFPDSRSALARVLRYWEREITDELKKRGTDPDDPYRADLRKLRLAVLKLWTDPESATDQLLGLWPRIPEKVAEELGRYGCRDEPATAPDGIRLPWRMDAVRASTRRSLLDMGFASGTGKVAESLRQAPTLGSKSWKAAMLGVGLIGVLGAGWPFVENAQPTVHIETPTSETKAWVQETAAGTRVIAGTRRLLLSQEVGAGADVAVTFVDQPSPRVERRTGVVLGGGGVKTGEGVLIHRGRYREPRRPWPGRQDFVLAWIRGPLSPEAETLADVLLDGGSVDQVWVGDVGPSVMSDVGNDGFVLELAGFRDELLVRIVPEDEHGDDGIVGFMRGEVLVVGDLPKLTEALNFEGIRPAAEVWAGAKTIKGRVQDWHIRGTGPKVADPMPDPAPAPPTPTPTPVPPSASGIPMMWLPGGEFVMGSPPDEAGRHKNESPQRRVRVAPFLIGITEVTQAQYEAVMGENPSRFKGENLPVDFVTWFQAVKFCNALSTKEGFRPVYEIHGDAVKWVDKTADGYRLPTEAEWEYAARAGTQTAYFFGDDASRLGEYAWFDKNSDNRTHVVGAVDKSDKAKKPNPWGLYDMYGNVWEWCWDYYGDYTNDNDKTTNDNDNVVDNPKGPESGASRVIRGGGFWSGAGDLRSSCRIGRLPDYWSWFPGFRIVRSSSRQP